MYIFYGSLNVIEIYAILLYTFTVDGSWLFDDWISVFMLYCFFFTPFIVHKTTQKHMTKQNKHTRFVGKIRDTGIFVHRQLEKCMGTYWKIRLLFKYNSITQTSPIVAIQESRSGLNIFMLPETISKLYIWLTRCLLGFRRVNLMMWMKSSWLFLSLNYFQHIIVLWICMLFKGSSSTNRVNAFFCMLRTYVRVRRVSYVYVTFESIIWEWIIRHYHFANVSTPILQFDSIQFN